MYCLYHRTQTLLQWLSITNHLGFQGNMLVFPLPELISSDAKISLQLKYLHAPFANPNLFLIRFWMLIHSWEGFFLLFSLLVSIFMLRETHHKLISLDKLFDSKCVLFFSLSSRNLYFRWFINGKAYFTTHNSLQKSFVEGNQTRI